MLACIELHNYLRLTDNACYTPSGFVDSEDKDGNFKPGEWRSLSSNYDGGLVPVPNARGSRSRENALGWVASLPFLALGSVYVGQGSTIRFVGSWISFLDSLLFFPG